MNLVPIKEPRDVAELLRENAFEPSRQVELFLSAAIEHVGFTNFSMTFIDKGGCEVRFSDKAKDYAVSLVSTSPTFKEMTTDNKATT